MGVRKLSLIKDGSMVNVALALALGLTGLANDGSENDNAAVVAQKAPLEYEAALQKAQKEEKPLLVLVGARWCASCQIMKKDTIEPMQKSGELDNVVITHVDKDKRPELAEQLMKGQTLPQIVVYSKRSGVWKRFSLTGMQSKNRMQELLAKVKAKRIEQQVR